ncbi:hypothetical protein AAZV13_03G043500 [Glycine max]
MLSRLHSMLEKNDVNLGSNYCTPAQLVCLSFITLIYIVRYSLKMMVNHDEENTEFLPPATMNLLSTLDNQLMESIVATSQRDLLPNKITSNGILVLLLSRITNHSVLVFVYVTAKQIS